MLYFISILLLLIIVLMVYISLEMRDRISQVNTLIKKQSIELCLLKNKIKEAPTPKAQNITITQYSPSNLEDIKDYVEALESRLELHYKMAENKHLFTELLEYFAAHKGLEFAKEKRDVMRLFKYIPSL